MSTSRHQIARQLWGARNSLERLVGSRYHTGAIHLETERVRSELHRILSEIDELLALQGLLPASE